MAYHARREGENPEEEKERANRNNANNVRNAANIAEKSGHPVAAGIGAGLKVADKVTGGKSSELIGKVGTQIGKAIPPLQDLSNKVNESGLGDKVGRASPLRNQTAGSSNNGNRSKANDAVQPKDTNPKKNQNQTPPNPNNNPNQNTGSGENGSSGTSSNNPSPNNTLNPLNRLNSLRGNNSNDNNQDSGKGGKGALSGMTTATKIILISSIVFVLPLILGIAIIGGVFVSQQENDYDDAFGISQEMGEDTGGETHYASDAQKAFYKRVSNIVKRYSSDGKTAKALNVVAAISVLNENNANLTYKKITDSDIETIVDAMFDDDGNYSDDTFKNNLINKVFPKYLPKASKKKRENMADDVFEYISDYYALIGKEKDTVTCSATGSCVYDIKGYHIGSGNVVDAKTVNNLYVRIMQCGNGYGGRNGKAMPGEELVPFEKYVLGVAYQEIGPGGPKEAFKAQLVAARSYALSRHASVGGWRTLKKEGDKWVLQLAGCTMDQVYCDPDKGCSSSDGQNAQVRSGTGHGRTLKKPMASNAPERTYAKETEGEVLVNKEGYIINTTYASRIQNRFTSLAKSGKTYKQILLQIYNQGDHNFGATDIKKNSCGGSSAECVESSSGNAASGSYAGWKQYQGPWINVQVGTSGKTIRRIGCLATSVAIQIARSGVKTNVSNFNPGTFVQYLNSHGGFQGGNFVWNAPATIAPTFKYVGKVSVAGMSQSQKLAKIKELTSQKGVYAVAEVKAGYGQHWVAIDHVEGNKVLMMDPGSSSTDMWGKYGASHTDIIAYYKVG